MIVEELRTALLDLCERNHDVSVDNSTVEAAREFLKATRQLKRQLKRIVDLEGVCNGK